MDLKRFKIKYGYDNAQYAEISEEELPKAYGMFLTGEGRGIFSDGTAIRAKDIVSIEPDWHYIRGWHKSWEMTNDDWADIKPLQSNYQKFQNEVKLLTEDLIKQGKTALLTKPLSELKEYLPKPNNEVSKLTEGLANKFKLQ